MNLVLATQQTNQIVYVQPTDNLGDVITNSPDGTEFIFLPGIHSFGPIVQNRNYLTFTGQPGAKLVRDNQSLSFEDCSHIVLQNLEIDMNALDAFKGIQFLNTSFVRLSNNWIYNSNAPAVGSSDRYAIVFRLGSEIAKNIWVENNVIDGLQLEVGQAENVWIKNNIINDSVLTGAISLPTNVNNKTLRNIYVSGNVIIDPVGRGIYCGIDSNDLDGNTFDSIVISHNRIVYNDVVKRGIDIGTSKTGATNTVFSSVSVVGNIINYESAATGGVDEAIMYHGDGLVFENSHIKNNTIVANPNINGWCIDLRGMKQSGVDGNIITGAKYGISISQKQGEVLIGDSNLIDASIADINQ